MNQLENISHPLEQKAENPDEVHLNPEEQKGQEELQTQGGKRYEKKKTKNKGKTFCEIDGCGKKAVGRGLCTNHWKKWSAYGDPRFPDQRGRIPHTWEWLEENFRKLYKVNGECWDWIWSKEKTWGYGRVVLSGQAIKAHRASYMIHVGDIPEGLIVCHLCDRPICVNPDHLFLGTDFTNNHDTRQKGRAVNRAIFTITESDKQNIRSLLSSGLTPWRVSKITGKAYKTIRKISNS